MQRLFITVSDLMVLTGTTERNCRFIINRVRDQFGKQKHQHITFKEYAQYEGVEINDVLTSLNIIKPEK